MSTATTTLSPDFAALIEAIAPKRFIRDPFGLFSGYRAYLVYTHLAAKSDEELAALGLTRATLPRVAIQAVFDSRSAA